MKTMVLHAHIALFEIDDHDTILLTIKVAIIFT